MADGNTVALTPINPPTDTMEAPLLDIKTPPSFVARFLRSGSIASSLAGLCYGIALGNMSAIVSGDRLSFATQKKMTDAEIQIVAALLQAGSLIGCLSSGPFCDKWGRAPSAVAATTFVSIGTGVCVLGFVWSLFVGRALMGLGLGALCHSIPLYVAEMAPTKWRGALDTSFQLFTTVGILVAFSVSVLLQHYVYNYFWILALPIISSGPLLIVMVLLPETPRWLFQHGHRAKAISILQGLYCTSEELQDAVAEMTGGGGNPTEQTNDCDKVKQCEVEGGQIGNGIGHQQSSTEPQQAQGTWMELLWKENRLPLLTGFGAMTLQTVTGIDVFTNYMPRIVAEMGMANSSLLSNVFLGITEVIFTIVAVVMVERLGRRKLLLIGSTGMTVCWGTITILLFVGVFKHEHTHKAFTFIGVGCILGIAAFFSVGWGPVAWLIPAECIGNRIRAKGMSLSIAGMYSTDFVVISTFLSLYNTVELKGVMLLYTVINVISVVFVVFMVPETKGKSLEEIEAMFAQKSGLSNPQPQLQ